MLNSLPEGDNVKYLKNFIKGVVVGVATLVPGVSGGTMAIILGIYDDLIHATGSFFEDWRKHILLLLEVGFGGLFGILLFSRLLENTLTKYPYAMQFLFMGIIIGGLPVLCRKSMIFDKRDKRDYIFLILGFIIVLGASSEPTVITAMAVSQGILSVMLLFFAGIVIAIALVLPGISGSFMLLALGLYEVTLSAINTLNIPFLIPLGLGVAAGILGTTKIIEKLLKKYPSKTYMLIIGFVIGSLVSVFPGIPLNSQYIISAAAFIIGFLITFWLGRKNFTD